MKLLPLFADVENQRCLIVGGGVVAARKARMLLRAGADVTVVSERMSPDIRALNDERLRLVEASFHPDVLNDYRLVIAATDDDRTNRAVADASASANVLCNVVDNLSLSSFIVPAIVDRSPVVVAISTGGAAPVLARRIKRMIETWLPARIGALAERAGRWRHLVKRRFPNGRARLRFWERFFDGAIAEHLLAGRERDAEHAFRREILTTDLAAERPTGEAYIVGAGPGDPALMTVRAVQLLGQADVVLYDALVSPEILDYGRKDATYIPVGKRPGDSDKQADIAVLLVRLVKEGKRVCRLKGGDPLIFGRGGEEAAVLAKHGLPYQIVPGISAALGCAADALVPLTHRGLASSVTFATAIVDASSEPDWTLLARPGQTLALYMAVRSLEKVAAKLIDAGLPPDTPAAVVENGTRPDQRVIEASIEGIADAAGRRNVRSPALLFVGETVGLRKQLTANQAQAQPWQPAPSHADLLTGIG